YQVLNFVVECGEFSFKQGVEKAMNLCNTQNFTGVDS
ncbi:aminoacyl-tRNA hydrolase, partial [Dolichospermum sp. ST_sed9]|nr:aminoacyl-tRNA hydrolase [Dolichospermum sp. ST_sed9]